MKKQSSHYVRRTATPQSRLKRAVAYRHQTYIHSNNKILNNVMDVNDKIVQAGEAKEAKAPIQKSLQPENNVDKKPNVHFSLPKVEKISFSQKRAKRKQEKRDELEKLALEPTVSLLRSLIDPVGMVNNATEVDHPTVNAIVRTILIFCKWVAMLSFPVVILYQIINSNPHGFSRINFTESSNIVFKYSIYATIAEILTYRVLELVCSTIKTYFDRSKVTSAISCIQLSQIVLFACSSYIYTKNPMIGVGLFVGSMIVAMFLQTYVLLKSTQFTRRMIIAYFLCMVVFSVGFAYFVVLTSGDIMRILQNIMNI